MSAYVVRRKGDHKILGVVNSTRNNLFNVIDDDCDPYDVEFCRSGLDHRYMIWEQFKFINMEYAEIIPAITEDSYITEEEK